MTRFALVLAAFLAGLQPAVAAPNAQLVASVQHRLDALGFAAVDAGQLSTRQIAALHMQLNRRSFTPGPRRWDTQQKVKVILRWDPPRTD